MSLETVFSASEIGDPDGTRTVIAIVTLLVVMGLALIMVAFWMRRSTRPDPELLAPLEAMGQRSWRRGDPVWQRRRLEEVRPADAEPLKRPIAPPTLDESFDSVPAAAGFDDLRDADEHSDRASPHDDDPDADLTSTPPDGVAATSSTSPDSDATAPLADPITVPETEAVADQTGIDETDDAEAEMDDTDIDETEIDDTVTDRADIDETDTEETVDGDGADDSNVAGGSSDVDGAEAAHTPVASERPLDDFSDHEIDQADIDRAMAELDTELGRGRSDE